MNYYREITLIDQTEVSIYFLWSKVFTQLHLCFVAHKDEKNTIPYGISFPVKENIFQLGNKLRILAHTEQELCDLNLEKYFELLEDYIHIKKTRHIPDDVTYVTFERFIPQKSLEERVIHQAMRRNISIDESQAHFHGYKSEKINMPYIMLKSLSSHSKFRLFIKMKKNTNILHGRFGTYGLSRNIAVPAWSE